MVWTSSLEIEELQARLGAHSHGGTSIPNLRDPSSCWKSTVVPTHLSPCGAIKFQVFLKLQK